MHTAGRHTSHSTARGCRGDWEGVWEWWRGVEAGWCGSNGAAPPPPPGTTHSLTHSHHLLFPSCNCHSLPSTHLLSFSHHHHTHKNHALPHSHITTSKNQATPTHSLPPSSHLVHLVSSLTHTTFETQTQQIKVGGWGRKTPEFLRRHSQVLETQTT